MQKKNRKLQQKMMDIYKQRKRMDKKIRKYCINFIKQINAPVFVEVGAYTGALIKTFHAENNNLKIIAIEPSAESMAKLKRHTADMNIEYYEFGVGFQRELFTSSMGSKSGCTSYVENATKNNSRVINTENINCIKLSEILRHQKTIDLMSINCEGGEYEMFYDDLDYLNRTSMVSIAMHSKSKLFQSKKFVQKRKEIVSMFQKFGFKMVLGIDDLNFKAHVVQLWQK